jgi:hypothetical protein
MVHENSKNLKLEVLPDDMPLTLWDAITRRDQWRSSIDVDPSAAASAPATANQLNTSHALIFLDTQLDQRQMQPPPPIREQPRSSPIRVQLRRSPPQT